MSAKHTFLVTSAPGLDELLGTELKELGCEGQLEGAGGVARIEGGWETAARIMTRSRIASRVLHVVRLFSAKNPAMLYDQVRRIPWPDYIPQGATIAVFVHGSNEGADYALSFAPLKIKDAICDEIKKLGFERPNVDRKNPDVRIEGFVHEGRCELSIDLSGAPLHRRGYREDGGEAPLRENRAAALLRFVGYDGSKPFVDPFCGSGTIAIEAALIAMKTAPGLLRKPEDYALWHIRPEAREALMAERDEARKERIENPPHPIVGSDISEKVLRDARENTRRAGLGTHIQIKKANATALVSPDSFIVANPPYGERLEDLDRACALLGDFTRQVKHACAPATLGLIVEAGALEKATGLKPSKKLLLKSGQMDTRLLKFEIFAGKRVGTAKPDKT